MYKYLGITIDYKLNFINHLRSLEQKINLITKRAFLFEKDIIPPHFFRGMIKSYIIPHILYCVDILHINEKAFQKLNEIYTRAAKKMIGFKKNYSYNNLI